MCLTIPKKVVAINGGLVTVELPDGSRQEVKTIIGLSVGDFVFSQQGVIIQKISKREAREVIELFQNKEGSKK